VIYRNRCRSSGDISEPFIRISILFRLGGMLCNRFTNRRITTFGPGADLDDLELAAESLFVPVLISKSLRLFENCFRSCSGNDLSC
jgi:hypothetical protein